jgi:DedD protein
MADRIAENADLIVDEMKRKARRRLVGAIVLALAAAIVLPMLLEKEPRPLGDDVSVRIPPVDESKFVNRLTGKSGDAKGLPKVDEKADAKMAAAKTDAAAARVPTASPLISVTPAAPRSPVAEAEQRVLAPATKAPAKADAGATPKPETKVESRPAAAEAKPAADAKLAVAEAKPAPDAKPAAAEAKPAPDAKLATTDAKLATTDAKAAPADAAHAAKVEGFVVQLAAFADDKGANALANKLKRAGYAAFVEPVQTSRGTLWRVRVGGYATKPEAEAARAKLKGEGFSGIVATAS